MYVYVAAETFTVTAVPFWTPVDPADQVVARRAYAGDPLVASPVGVEVVPGEAVASPIQLPKAT